MEPAIASDDLAGQPGVAGSHARRAALLVLLGSVLFGTTGTARALLAPNASNVSVGAVRVIVGGFSLLAVMPWIGGSRPRTVALCRRKPIFLMGCATALYQVCFFAAMAMAGIALGTLVTVGSVPIISGLLGWIVLGHRPSRTWVAATAVALVGLMLLCADALGGSGGGIGVLLGLVAGLSNATYNVVSRPLLDDGVEPMELVSASFMLASVLLVPGLLTQPLGWLGTTAGVALASYLGTATAGLANTWLARGVGSLGPGPAGTLMLLDPVTATLLGILVLGEPIVPTAALGMVLVLAGLAIQAAVPRRRTPTIAVTLPQELPAGE
ncbi:MAG TPA: DMT family transporter [Candidatus Limnocylindria bacterium]|jgi:DME family drug/metabolite transporter|nr:DMT family transporter [Candidatus Limnocylindria bacterium]